MTAATHEPDSGAATRAANGPQHCLACGHDNPHDANFCNECGFQLNLRYCPHCDAVNARAAFACYKCGNAFDVDASFDDSRAHAAATTVDEAPAAAATADDAVPHDAYRHDDVPALASFAATDDEPALPLTAPIFATRDDAPEVAGEDGAAATYTPNPSSPARSRWPVRLALTLLLLPFAAILIVGMLPPLQRPAAELVRTAWDTLRARAIVPAASIFAPAPASDAGPAGTPGTAPGAADASGSVAAPSTADPSPPTETVPAAAEGADPATTPPLTPAANPASDAPPSPSGVAAPTAEGPGDATIGAVTPSSPVPVAAAAATATTGASAVRPPAKGTTARTSSKGNRAATTAPATRGRSSPAAPRRTSPTQLRRTSDTTICAPEAAVLGLCP